MAAPHMNRIARGRLAGNDNETIVVADEPDTEAHRLAANENETVVAAVTNDDDTVSTDATDTEAHRLASNDNETTVKGAPRLEGDGKEQSTAPDAARG
jgi:hypothetical protein